MSVECNTSTRDPIEVFIVKTAISAGVKNPAGGYFLAPSKSVSLTDLPAFVIRVFQVYKGQVLSERDFPADLDGDQTHFNKATQYAQQLSSDVIHVVDDNDGAREV